MIPRRRRYRSPLMPPYSLFLWYAAIMHLYWAVAIWATPLIVWTTALAPIYVTCRQSTILTCVVLLLASGSMVILLLLPTQQLWHLTLGFLQQILLLISTFGCLAAVWHGSYADGTSHSAWFILADQMPIILTTAFHSVSLIGFHKERTTLVLKDIWDSMP